MARNRSHDAEVVARVRAGELTQTAAGKLMGCGRNRVQQLVKKAGGVLVQKPKPVVLAQEAPHVPADPGGVPPVAPAGAPRETAPPPDLKAVLAATGQSPDPPRPSIAVDAVPHVEQSEVDRQLEREDAEAGAELLKLIPVTLGEAAAKYIYRVDPDDPRLEDLKESNGFLRVTLKRNEDKAAPLGWLTRGWKGLAIGFAIEIGRVVMRLSPITAKPGEPSPEDPPATDKDQAGRDLHTKRGRDKAVEAAPGPRLSLAEKVALFQKSGG